MEVTVIAVVLLAAFLHAFWNFQVRGSDDKALGIGAIMIGHLPLAFVGLMIVGLPPFSSWPFLMASAVFHLGYQIFLMNAYRHGELTQIYPIARGVAPLLITLISMIVIKSDFSGQQIVGILMVSGGIILHGIFQFHRTQTPLTGMVLALITGCFIAGYSLVDGYGTRHAGSALSFYGAVTAINGAVFMIYLRVFHPGVLSRITTDGRKILLIGGNLSYIAYVLVLWACLSAPIAVVSALRETSVIFALLLGTTLLKEKLTVMKIVVTIIILAGVIILRLA
ncbi:EamA family transporter [Candidatus Puniceispirillum sp.]|jgi:drug/metabolite transporter (DMT)-like permease|uniref:EamA family transporter n=1 Tax=Candidatus Puniceispirillum sp. TaxID=2026719 RepID=UPI001EC8A7D4|nr:EamA family transporter [Candidatus Puniceispirillum sp.]MBT6566935.1 EamA family transporter [Candidatus Puniceispirillum sp.]